MTRILITRPEPDASQFAELCVARGFQPVIAPMMRISFGGAPIDDDGIGSLAFTSANGVRAFIAQSDRRDLPVFAVGSQTAGVALDAGFQKVQAADGDVESLAALIADKNPPTPVLHVAGSARAGDLVALLQMRGVAAVRCVGYNAVAATCLSPVAKQALENPDDNLWIVFFSPRTARIFMSLVKDASLSTRLSAMSAACLSAAVANEIERHRWRRVRVAGQRDAESLLDLIS